MPEAAVRLGVSVDNAVVGVGLGAVVVSKFQNGMSVCPVAVTLEGVRAVVGKEVEREFVFGEVELLDLVQTEEFVEIN